ncbi:fasciclin domain-containing protein [Myxococcota bacterium]|nr:fasciclin domain-containing protein [Myxococcota bacterium]
MQLAAKEADLSTWVDLVKAAGLDAALGGTQASFTVFAPSNAAFAAVPAADLNALKEDPEALSAVLRFHMLPGFLSSEALGSGGEFRTITSTIVRVGGTATSLTVADYLGVSASVSKANIKGKNGVIHIIDKVLTPPPGEEPPPVGVCGDGTVDEGEVCDDGNTAWPDNCAADCSGSFVILNFTIDDSANKTYAEADLLRWKGSFQYDAETRIITHDPSWAGGDSTKYPLVYDDGPWDMGGHEPAGATAGDNIWGIAAFFATPDQAVMFEYGAEYNNGSWIWRGSNGTFTVPANADGSIDVTGLVIPAFGTIDLKLEIDTSSTALAEGFTFTPGVTTLTVKGSAWGWQEVDLVQVGATNVYEFILSDAVGPGTTRPHAGLLNSGDQAEFVFVIGGVEYKAGGEAASEGVMAYLKVPPATEFSAATVERNNQNGNTYVEAP